MKKWRKWDIDCIQSSIWILAAISVCIYGGLELIVWVLMEDNLVAPDNLWPVARYIFNFLWYEETFWNLFAGWKKNRPRSKADTACSSIAPVIRHSITGNNEIKRDINIISNISSKNNININQNNITIINKNNRFRENETKLARGHHHSPSSSKLDNQILA